MIILKKLEWDNCFSYGKQNSLNLNNSTLTQLVGTNGTGKSSLPLIIEEVLYNKNSKGIKKADIQNRFKNAGYSIKLTFSVDDNEYKIDANRSRGNIKVKLYKNNEDISSHTATNTYKTVQEILGLDFKTFTQLVYQNTNASLQFLTATDANRKKFLIELLNLEDYVEYYDVFRELSRQMGQDVSKYDGKEKTIVKWLNDNKLKDTTIVPMKKLPEYSEIDEKALRDLSIDFENIVEKNQKINDNNIYKQLFYQLDLGLIQSKVKKPESYHDLISQQGRVQGYASEWKTKEEKYGKLEGSCPTCNQPVATDFIERLIDEAKDQVEGHELRAIELQNKIQIRKDEEVNYEKFAETKREFEDLHSRINADLPTDTLDGGDLSFRIEELKKKITDAKSQIQKIAEENEETTKRNTRIQVILEQTGEFENELEAVTSKLSEIEEKSGHIEILKKAFSTNGLIAYKIENMVKDLEDLANDYLAELSDGRFSINFVVTNDKLNVEVTDNGKIIAITALSSGELTRVNTATLVAIRKLMSSISKSRINVLFLDEVINVLDEQGREKLVEVLLQEEDLNTYIVSHGWTHPLLEKIEVIKEGNISRLE
jgi:DNA repair exonuclease SbcCD ATPase subunit